MQRVTADEFILPALLVGVELDALAAVALAQRFLEVGEEVPLPRRARFLLRRPACALDDLGDARLRDDLIALERQHRHFAPVAFAGPEEHGVRGGVHVHNHRPRVAFGQLPNFDRLAPAVVHRERHRLLLGR